jgi:hypothetical protein
MGQGGSFEIGRRIIDVRCPWRAPLRGCRGFVLMSFRHKRYPGLVDSLASAFDIHVMTHRFAPPSRNMRVKHCGKGFRIPIPDAAVTSTPVCDIDRNRVIPLLRPAPEWTIIAGMIAIPAPIRDS